MELVLSASSVAAYRGCEYRWYLQYVEQHAGDQTFEKAVGLAVHAGIELYYKAILAGEDGPELEGESVDAADLHVLLEMSSIVDPDMPISKIRGITERVTRSYIEDVGSQINPTMVEQAGRLVVNGIEFSYHLDLADDEDILRDTKVLKAKPRFPEKYAFAMTGYALGFRDLTGRIERDVQLDVMIRLIRDRPYHVPISNGGPITDHDIGIFAAQLEDTAEGIARGSFRPTGLDKQYECRYCPVRNVCEYVAEEA